MNYIFDTYAWIEYFLGSKKGIIVKNILENSKNTIITLDSCIAEIYLWCLREEKDFEFSFKLIKSCSSLEKIDLSSWIEAAKIRHENRKKISRFGIMDAIILAKQKETGCTILTGDKHFKDLKNVIFLE
mgnify:CR=1 FL=1